MTETQRLPQKPGETMTIGDWLITFLLTSIPPHGPRRPPGLVL